MSLISEVLKADSLSDLVPIFKEWFLNYILLCVLFFGCLFLLWAVLTVLVSIQRKYEL